MAKYERFAGLLNEVAAHQTLHRLAFLHVFDKKPELDTAPLVWTNSATDVTNIAGGWNQYFMEKDVAHAGAIAFDIEGLKVSTAATAQYDAVIIKPHEDETIPLIGKSGIFILSAGYNLETAWAMKTGSSIADVLYLIGNQDAPVSVLGTSTYDQACFYFHPGTSANWLYATSVAGTATVVDTGVVVTASTPYLLKAIHRASDLKTEIYINGVYVGVTAVNANDTNMYPCAAIATNTTAAKHFFLRSVELAVDYGDK